MSVCVHVNQVNHGHCLRKVGKKRTSRTDHGQRTARIRTITPPETFFPLLPLIDSRLCFPPLVFYNSFLSLVFIFPRTIFYVHLNFIRFPAVAPRDSFSKQAGISVCVRSIPFSFFIIPLFPRISPTSTYRPSTSNIDTDNIDADVSRQHHPNLNPVFSLAK